MPELSSVTTSASLQQSQNLPQLSWVRSVLLVSFAVAVTDFDQF